MSKDIFKLDKTLSIVELENRQELTIVVSPPESCKGANERGTGRCDN